MYKIGEFSSMAKTTVKTLRYYEREGLLKPSFVDEQTGYRYYETKQLIQLSKIVSLRQIGFSIKNIKDVLNGEDMEFLLKQRKTEIEEDLAQTNFQLSKINYLLEGKNMKYEVVVKEIPKHVIYYREGVVLDYSEITEFILRSAKECKKINPNIKCVEPDYCYMNYLDGEYKESNIKIRYCQAVQDMGVSNENIKFKQMKPVKAVCIYHCGSYDTLGEAYGFIMKYIEDNGYEIIDLPRERYIDGIWNKENTSDWLTEIQVPIA